MMSARAVREAFVAASVEYGLLSNDCWYTRAKTEILVDAIEYKVSISSSAYLVHSTSDDI